MPLLFDAADAIDAPTSAPAPIAPKAAPKALTSLNQDDEGPRLIFPPDGATVQVDGVGPKSRGLVLAAGGDGLTWYADGVELPADPISGQVLWRPPAPGFYHLEVIDSAGKKVVARVRIRE